MLIPRKEKPTLQNCKNLEFKAQTLCPILGRETRHLHMRSGENASKSPRTRQNLGRNGALSCRPRPRGLVLLNFYRPNSGLLDHTLLCYDIFKTILIHLPCPWQGFTPTCSLPDCITNCLSDRY